MGKGTTLSVVLSRPVVVMVVLILMALAIADLVAPAPLVAVPVSVQHALKHVYKHPLLGEHAVCSLHLEEWPQ